MPKPASDKASDDHGQAVHRDATLTTARKEGLLGIRDRTIGARVPSPLIAAAKAHSGIQSDSELLLYALSKVALEDGFAAKLVARKGRIPKDLGLDRESGV